MLEGYMYESASLWLCKEIVLHTVDPVEVSTGRLLLNSSVTLCNDSVVHILDVFP